MGGHRMVRWIQSLMSLLRDCRRSSPLPRQSQNGISRIAIPESICPDEILIRGIFHSVHVRSNGQLKPEAFLPRQNESGVSVLRLKYSTFSECYTILKEMPLKNQTFYGMAYIRSWLFASLRLKAVSCPLTPDKVAKEGPGFEGDDGSPMHAELRYPESPVSGQPISTEMKEIARRLAKTALYDGLPDQSLPE